MVCVCEYSTVCLSPQSLIQLCVCDHSHWCNCVHNHWYNCLIVFTLTVGISCILIAVIVCILIAVIIFTITHIFMWLFAPSLIKWYDCVHTYCCDCVYKIDFVIVHTSIALIVWGHCSDFEIICILKEGVKMKKTLNIVKNS